MYSEIVKKSLDIWWKNKRLWIVGILAALTLSVSTSSYSNSSSKFGSEFLIFLSIFSLIVMVINFSYTITIGMFADAGLIIGYGDLYKGKSIGSVMDILKTGKKYWLRMIGLTACFIIPIFVIVFVVMAVLFLVFGGVALLTSGAGAKEMVAGVGLIIILAMCFLGVIGFVFSIIWAIHFNMAQRVLLLEDKGVIDSIKISFHMLKVNFWRLIEGVIVLFGIEILLMIVLLLPAILVGVIVFAIAAFVGIAALALEPTMPLISAIILTVFGVITSILVSIAGSFLSSFGQVYWNMIYFKLTEAKNHLVNGEPEKESLAKAK